MKISTRNAAPKYVQLKAILRQYFEREHYAANQKIPSEHELTQQFDVSRSTVRQALAELVKEGYIYKKPGSGSFFSGQRSPTEESPPSHLIGVITALPSYIYPQIVQGINEIAYKRGYNIVLGTSHADWEKELACLDQLLERGIDGLILEPSDSIHHLRESGFFERLSELAVPVVLINWGLDVPNVSYVSVDDVEGGYRATNYLIEAGHRRIACLYPENIPGQYRYQGYRNALKAAGIPPDSRLEKSASVQNWNETGYIRKLMRDLLDLGTERPSAVFCFNDHAALRTYATIREAGLKIPDDISLMGFDDYEMAALAEVPLTTMVHPKVRLGKWAAEVLFEQIELNKPDITMRITMAPTIIIRDSVKILK
jgi:GntR family transcriptional regulator, arabinose operon transcriptional repressor